MNKRVGETGDRTVEEIAETIVLDWGLCFGDHDRAVNAVAKAFGTERALRIKAQVDLQCAMAVISRNG